MWFEDDPQRFDRIRTRLSRNSDVQLSTRQSLRPQEIQRPTEQPLMIYVTYERKKIKVSILPPAGTGIAGFQQSVLTEDDVARISEGGGVDRRTTPDFETLNDRGIELGKLLLRDQIDAMLPLANQAKTVIVHDVASSRLPFELLASSVGPAAIQGGFNRRLVVRGVPVERILGRPPRMGKLKVLLIVNPRSDLPGSAKEGDAVEGILEHWSTDIDRVTLKETAATKANVLMLCRTSTFFITAVTRFTMSPVPSTADCSSVARTC